MKRPNILILYTDQQRFDALGCNGNSDLQTPRLDALAREGVNFERYYVQNPVCMPSRVSFLTGQYPGTLGITHMGVPVPENTATLPRYLRNYGYRCANIGKLHFLPHANRDHRAVHPAYGFDQLEISDEPGCYNDAYRAWVERRAPDQLDLISCGLPPATQTWQSEMGERDGIVHPAEREPLEAQPFRGRSDLTHTAFVAEQTIEFMRENHASPFLCVAGFYSPHAPWIAPQEFLDLYDPSSFALPDFPADFVGRPDDAQLRRARHGYYAMISEVDHHCGRILDELDALGLREDTIVIFTADHGEWLGEHGKYGKGYPADDAVSRVPCLVRWPNGIVEVGRTVSDIVEAVDIVPTLLECAGIPIAPILQGRSLYPQLRAQASKKARMAALTEEREWKALHTPRFRYIARASGQEILFDLERPHGEYCDVAELPVYAQTLAELRHELLRRLIERERPLERVWPY